MLTFIYILFISIFSLVWCWILTEDSMITERLYLWLKSKLEDKYNWLYLPLIGCPKCNAGQIAFWLFIYLDYENYNLLHHIFFTTTTIFLTSLLMKFYIKINQNERD